MAYSARDNLLQVVKCKTDLDFNGVHASDFDGIYPTQASRHGRFNDPQLRALVFERSRLQFSQIGVCC